MCLLIFIANVKVKQTFDDRYVYVTSKTLIRILDIRKIVQTIETLDVCYRRTCMKNILGFPASDGQV